MQRDKNSLFDTYLSYLQKFTPHRSWHYGLAGITVLIAGTFFLRDYHEWDRNAVQLMAVPILSIYWYMQFRVMQSAVRINQYEWHLDLSDELIGAVPQRHIMLAKVRAILWHHRYFVVFMCLALLGLSLATAGFLLFRSTYFHIDNYDYKLPRGILKYVGAITTGIDARMSSTSGFSLVERIWYPVILGSVLLILTYMNSLVSASMGIWASRLEHALVRRLFLIAVVFAIFLSLYMLRETPAWTCHRNYMIPDKCSDMLLQMRTIDSIQAISLAFFDGGTAMVSGLHGCPNYLFRLNGSEGRHLMAAGTTIIVQLALSGFFLWHSSFSQHKKKTSYTFCKSG
jgi:hypothetical protein